MLTVSNLTKRYETTLAADNLSFSVSPGEVAVLLGPNGAGGYDQGYKSSERGLI